MAGFAHISVVSEVARGCLADIKIPRRVVQFQSVGRCELRTWASAEVYLTGRTLVAVRWYEGAGWLAVTLITPSGDAGHRWTR